MKPKNGAYTVAMPWYERSDFAQLIALADDRDDMSPTYEVWRSKALRVAEQYLARGQALQMVTIKPAEFLAWAKERQLPNTTATRLHYVGAMAAGQSFAPFLNKSAHERREANEFQTHGA